MFQLDTGRDVSIGLSVEDAALYASIDPDNFLTTSVCFCDLDYLDLNVSLLDEPRPGITYIKSFLVTDNFYSSILIQTFIFILKMSRNITEKEQF